MMGEVNSVKHEKLSFFFPPPSLHFVLFHHPKSFTVAWARSVRDREIKKKRRNGWMNNKNSKDVK